MKTNDSAEFPSCLNPLFQSETKCDAIFLKNIFYSHANKTHFHNKRFALSLVLECNRASVSLAFKLCLRPRDFKKGFEILCPWIRGQLKNPGVCALGFSFAPCKGIRIPKPGKNFALRIRPESWVPLNKTWSPTRFRETFRFTVLCFVVTLSLSSTSETKWYLLHSRPPYCWSWNLPAGRKGNGH